MQIRIACMLLVHLALAPLTFQVQATAQTTTATIYGRVTTAGGEPLQGAVVTALNEATSSSKTAQTDGKGRFTITFLPVGNYAISISLAGFNSYLHRGLRLSAGQELNRTFILQPGAGHDVVTEEPQAIELEASGAEEAIRHSESQASDMPLEKRDFTSLVDVGTGVSKSGEGVSINGLPGEGFTFTVDGTNASGSTEVQSLSSVQGFNFVKGISLGSVEEVQVSKNIFSAEISNALGGNVNVITKSGTNQFHGSVFETYQCGGLSARNQFIAQKQPLVFHQFGGSIGGPILRGRTFFFFAYEGYRLTAERLVNGNVPTAVFRSRAIESVPEYREALELFPLPTDPHPADAVTGFFEGLGHETATEDHTFLRLDHQFSESDTFSARYSRARPFRQIPRTIEENPRSWDGRIDRIGLNYTHSSTSWSAETRFGHNFNRTRRLDGVFGLGIPGISYPDFGVTGEIFIPSGDITSFEEVLATSKGSHSLKVGGVFTMLRSRRENEELPDFFYATPGDLLGNLPSTASFAIGPEAYQIQTWQSGFFLQDAVRLTPRLMLNMGIRYDYYAVPQERDNRLGNRDEPLGLGSLRDPGRSFEPDYNNFSPRFGLAWSPGPEQKTILNAGFGVFHGPAAIQSTVTGLVRDRIDGKLVPTDVLYSRQEALELGIDYPTSNDEIREILTTRPVQGGRVSAPELATPYSLQWTLRVQRRVSDSLVWNLAYVGSRGVKLIMLRDINQPDRLTGELPHPDFIEFNRADNSDSSHYHSLQTSLKARFSSNFSLDLDYTWSRSLAYTTQAQASWWVSRPQDNDKLWLEKGPTSEDIPHRLVTNFVYEIPWRGMNRRRVAELLLSGWQLSGILTAQSGETVNIIQNSVYGQSRPDFIGANYESAYLDDGLQYLDPKAFRKVPVSTESGATIRPGTLGRNAFRLPGYWNADLSLSKYFQVTEHSQLRARVDFFNAFNQTHFNAISQDTNSASFGRFTQTRGARVAQFSLHFSF